MQAKVVAFVVLFSPTNTTVVRPFFATDVAESQLHSIYSSQPRSFENTGSFLRTQHDHAGMSHESTNARLRGGGSAENKTELLQRQQKKNPNKEHQTGTNKSSDSTGSGAEREESLVHFSDETCKIGSNVMISRNFTKVDWAKLYVGRTGTLVGPAPEQGIWTASFGNVTANFRVGLDGVSQLAYFDERIPEHHYRLAAAIISINGNSSEAKAIFERALEIEPTNVNCLSGYGMLIHSKFHDCPRAEEHFKRALELAPHHVDTLCNYGAVLLDEFKRDYQARPCIHCALSPPRLFPQLATPPDGLGGRRRREKGARRRRRPTAAC